MVRERPCILGRIAVLTTKSIIVVIIITITVGLLHKKSKLGIMPRLEKYTDGHGVRGCHNYHATRKFSKLFQYSKELRTHVDFKCRPIDKFYYPRNGAE